MQTPVVLLADLIHDVQSQSPSRLARELLPHRIGDRLRVTPLGHVEPCRQTFLNSDSEIAHTDNGELFAHLLILISLGHQNTVIPTVIQDIVTQLGYHILEIRDLSNGITQLLAENRTHSGLQCHQHGLDITTLLNIEHLEQTLIVCGGVPRLRCPVQGHTLLQRVEHTHSGQITLDTRVFRKPAIDIPIPVTQVPSDQAQHPHPIGVYESQPGQIKHNIVVGPSAEE